MATAAEDRLAAAARAVAEARKEHGSLSPEVAAADDARVKIEGEVAAEAGLEWAEPFVLSPLWDSGAPRPVVLASEWQLSVAYFVAPSDPATDAAPPDGPPPVGVLTFDAADHRFGGPNDEVLHGHPLYGRGLTFYGAHVVHNSRWTAELEAINSVHSRYDPARGSRHRHYLLAFHDSTFECLANGYQAEVVYQPMADVIARLADQLAR